MLTRILNFAFILMTVGFFLHHAGNCVQGAEPDVKLKKNEHSVEVFVNGELFTAYNTNPEVRKPYLYPLFTQGKKSVTRELNLTVKAEDKNKLYDHVHHKGIWISIDEVNKQKHWSEKHVIVNKSVVHQANVITAVNHWLAEDKTPLLEETTRMTFHANRVIDFQINLKALVEKVEIEDTKEGLLAVRMSDDLREQSGGLITNSNGKKTEKEAWGQQANWVDYHGKRGNDTLGVAIFDATSNPHPARYHVRAYGLFSANPFGDKAYTEKSTAPQPTHEPHLKKGDSLTLNYGIYIHTGDTNTAKVQEEFNKFDTRIKTTTSSVTPKPVPLSTSTVSIPDNCGCSENNSAVNQTCHNNYCCSSRRQIRKSCRVACR